MTSIGTLLAFVIVCVGIMVMRRTNPDAAAALPYARSCRSCRFSASWSASP